jgi:DNA-binding transcriptional LysR family regulator
MRTNPPSPGLEAAQEPLCFLTPNMQNRRIIDRAFAVANAHPSPRLETNSIMNLLASVKSMGLASIMPEYFINVLGHLEGVKAVPLVEPKVEHKRWVSWASPGSRSPP